MGQGSSAFILLQLQLNKKIFRQAYHVEGPYRHMEMAPTAPETRDGSYS